MKKITLIIIALLLANLGFSQSQRFVEYTEKISNQFEKGDYEGAIETLSLAINEMPDSVRFYSMRGILLDAFQMYPEAIQDITKGLEKIDNPKEKVSFLVNRGGAKAKIRDYKGAYNDLIQAVSIDSTNMDALNNLAVVCDEVNKPDETLKYLNQIIKIDSSYMPAYVNIGFKYQGLGEHKKAIEYFDFALKLSPDEPLAYSNRSFSKLKTNDLKGAMKDINESIKLLPTNSYAYKIRALIFIEKKLLDEACRDLVTADKLGYTQQYGEEVNLLKEKYCIVFIFEPIKVQKIEKQNVTFEILDNEHKPIEGATFRVKNSNSAIEAHTEINGKATLNLKREAVDIELSTMDLHTTFRLIKGADYVKVYLNKKQVVYYAGKKIIKKAKLKIKGN
ncbi:MAG: hypothetical protein JJT94_04515 [Bernardetiaceae bacterium]|nr:hypothetical protein [Bernardetiaceae bacterium]